MENEDRDRRLADESFKYKLIEQQAQIQEGIKDIRDDIKEHGRRLTDIESTLWGYPKGDSIGLLEKHRALLRTWAIIIAVLSFLATAFARIISPLYDKWVSDWAFNSPSQKWLKEQQRPKVKVYKIYRKDVGTAP